MRASTACKTPSGTYPARTTCSGTTSAGNFDVCK
jgi:hypothetical protein